jgi:carboxymethylenebutenolidase
MGKTIELTASDGHKLSAYQADAAGTPKGGMIVIQEIFGVNKHIREVADLYAGQGYTSIAPALFDRAERGVETGYTPADQERVKPIRAALKWDQVLADVAAARDALKKQGIQKIGIVGYCFGGSVSWLTACRVDGIAAAACYYGGNIADFANENPKCPVIIHVGDQDKSITADKVETVKKAHPDIPYYVYPGAGHGFNCDHRGSFHKESADLARQRTFEFFKKNIG